MVEHQTQVDQAIGQVVELVGCQMVQVEITPQTTVLQVDHKVRKVGAHQEMQE